MVSDSDCVALRHGGIRPDGFPSAQIATIGSAPRARALPFDRTPVAPPRSDPAIARFPRGVFGPGTDFEVFAQQSVVVSYSLVDIEGVYTPIKGGLQPWASPEYEFAPSAGKRQYRSLFVSSGVTTFETRFGGVRVEVRTSALFDDVVDRLNRLCGKSSIPELVKLAKEDISEGSYVSEIERRFVGESGFMLSSEIDHGGWIVKFGIRRRTVRWILGNPLIAITMLRHDISAGLFAPVEVLLTEASDGEGTSVTYVRPSTLIVLGENPELKEAALALDRKFESLIERITVPR